MKVKMMVICLPMVAPVARYHLYYRLNCHIDYRVVPAHRNWQIETAGWNWAGFFTEGLETRWQRFGQFLNDL